MKHIYLAHLHSCGFSQNDLEKIFEAEEDIQDFFEKLDDTKIGKYVKNLERKEKIFQLRKKIDTGKNERLLEKLGVTLITKLDEKYPESLKQAPHAPFLLYVRGEIPQIDMFAVVGARNMSSYGNQVISQVLPDIAKIMPIVSGGAAGCDTSAHKCALQHGAKTVAVLGTGIDECYPVMNRKLFDTIAKNNGAVISIFPIGEPGNPYNFPVRNEVVVGLSRGVLVVEAKEKSGSLITANLALDLGRDLFAIPGNIGAPLSIGTNRLIATGMAKLVENSQSILEEYDILVKKSRHKDSIPELDSLEKMIYDSLSQEHLRIETLSENIGASPAEIATKLSFLELQGVVKKDISGTYRLI